MKVKEIGKILLILFCMEWGFVQARSDISMQVVDHRGHRTQKIQLGTPFFIDVTIASEEHCSYPKLETDESIQTKLEGSSTSIQSINGNRSVSKNFRYSARADEEGTYKIGPAIALINGVSQESEVQEITIAEGISATSSGREQTETHLEIHTDKKTFYKGEEIEFSLRLYMTDDSVRIEGIQEPLFTGCTAAPLEGPTSGEETIKGVPYKYLEWKTKIYAHAPGTFVIPAIAAHITIENQRVHDMHNTLDLFSMMGNIFGNRVESRQLLSNVLKLTVLDLPPSKEPVSAFGSFTSFTAKTNLESAVEGEGIVYTLELVGQGNFAMISHQKLQLPDGLNYYDSKIALHQLGAGISKKDFEYIIQAMHPGDFVIPSQIFTYFDKQKHEYKTIKSKPVSITIQSSDRSQSEVNIMHEEISNDQQSQVVQLDSIEEDVWQDSVSRQVSWHMFVIILSLIAMGYALYGVYVVYHYNKERNAPYASYRKAFKTALHHIELCEKKKEPQKIQDILMNLFATRLQLPKNGITQERIEQALIKAQFEPSDIQAWKDFLVHLMATEYGATDSTAQQYLFHEAKVWIQKLEGKV